jgi:hypothetical protein
MSSSENGDGTTFLSSILGIKSNTSTSQLPAGVSTEKSIEKTVC